MDTIDCWAGSAGTGEVYQVRLMDDPVNVSTRRELRRKQRRLAAPALIAVAIAVLALAGPGLLLQHQDEPLARVRLAAAKVLGGAVGLLACVLLATWGMRRSYGRY